MSITEEIVETPQLAPGTARVLLVWDAPNLDMGLGSILGGRPTAAHRPRFDARPMAAGLTAELAAGHDNVSWSRRPPSSPISPGQRRRGQAVVEALRTGFGMEPKVDEDSDVDVDMLNHIASP